MDYTNIKTFEDACAALGLDPNAVLPFATPANEDQVNDNDVKKLKIIAKALKGEHVPNWDNRNEEKRFPVFRKEPSGFGFSLSYCHYAYSFTAVGSRFVFPSEEVSDYYANQFIEIHQRVLMFN